MIDALYARYTKPKDKTFDPSYRPQNAILRRIFSNAKAHKLAVIFPGWHTHHFPVDSLVSRLIRKGWAVLSYDFHDQILEADDKVVAESFKFIRDTVAEDLDKLVKKHGYQQIHFIGLSLGNVAMAMVTERFSGFTGATIIVGGDDLAVDMWHGLRTLNYRDAFRKLNVGMRKLDREWHQEAPVNHSRHFAHKPVLFYISLHDKFIRTEYQKKLLSRLVEAGADVKVKHSRVGHLLSAIRYCYFGPLP